MANIPIDAAGSRRGPDQAQCLGDWPRDCPVSSNRDWTDSELHSRFDRADPVHQAGLPARYQLLGTGTH